MIELLSALTVMGQVALVVLALCVLVQSLTPHAPADRIAAYLADDALRLAALVAVVAMAGSLYMSEVRHFIPCPLCWYQRIAMYSLALLLPLMAYVRETKAHLYGLALAVPGAAISMYHYQLERFPDQEQIACSVEVPCTTIWFESLGYITIPMMALTAFLLIIALLLINRRKDT